MNRYKQHSIIFLKHIIIALFIALGAIGITSCSTDDDAIVNLPNESTAVLFHTVVDKDIQTRGASMDNDALKNEGFGVLAYYTQNSAWTAAAATATPNFMHNQKISWSTTNSLWNYSPIRYWPNNTNDKVSFFAYAPYEETPATGAIKGIKLSSNTTNNTPAIDFTVNNEITNQVDLVYASEKDKNRELIDLNFKHALSRIAFSAKAGSDYGDTKIKVKNVAIKGKFYPTGTFTYSNLLNDGSWGNFETPATTGITYTPGLNSNASALETFVQRINEDNQHIMVIPQNFEGANKFAIETTYTSITNGVESPLQKTVSEDINLNFEQGSAYNFTLNIRLSQIEITVEVSDWNNVNLELAVQDGQHKLGVSQGEFTFFRGQRSYENELVVTTNYPEGWTVKKIVDASNNAINWLTVTPDNGDMGVATPTTLTLSKNEEETTRTSFIHLSAGRLTYIVKVNQLAEAKFDLSITDAADKPISLLEFIAKKDVQPTPQQMNLEWAPVTSTLFYNINVMSNPFVFDISTGNNEIPASGSFPNSTGTQAYSISPPAITSAELDLDPFYDRSSILLYSISDGTSTINKTVILRQYVPAVVPVVDDFYLMDGVQKSFSVRSNTPFTVDVISNPNNVITSLETTGGESNTTEAGTPVSFTIIDGTNDPTLFQEDIVVTISSPANLFEPIDVNLNCINGVIQPKANSYIVAPSGVAILIPVGRANETTYMGVQLGANEEFNTHLVWTDNAAGQAPNSNVDKIIKLGAGSSGYIAVKPGSADGNALVAIRNLSSKILWSWHIWVTDYNPTSTVTGSFMDRNLGATDNTPGQLGTKGLLYQWGRKDPFPGSNIIDGNSPDLIYDAQGDPVPVSFESFRSGRYFDKSIANPTVLYRQSGGTNNDDWVGERGDRNDDFWGRLTTTQTIYDPCPAGWRVLKSTVWINLSNSANSIWSNSYGLTNNDFGGYYPAAGYRKGTDNGVISDVGTRGFYWSASINNYEARDLYIQCDAKKVSSGQNVRSNAYSIRCVKE